LKKNKVIETTKLYVPLKEFSPLFYKYINLTVPKEIERETDKKYLCMKTLAAEYLPHEKDEVVTLERFALCTKWFGSLTRPDNKTILDEMLEVVSHAWFHGDISKKEAQNLLTSYNKTKAKANTFLIRLSTSEPINQNPFTISKVNKELKTVHQRVYLENGEYYITVKDNNKIGSSKGLCGLIAELEKQKVLLAGETPPRTKYQIIFTKNGEDLGYIDM